MIVLGSWITKETVAVLPESGEAEGLSNMPWRMGLFSRSGLRKGLSGLGNVWNSLHLQIPGSFAYIATSVFLCNVS